MGRDGRVSDHVGVGIDGLEASFGSFPVNQTTLSVGDAEYEAARADAGDGTVVLYVRVTKEDGTVLHVDGDGDLAVPQCAADPGGSVRRQVRDAVETQVGVQCEPDGVVRATIAGVHNKAAPDSRTVYRLVALVDADSRRGEPAGAVWESGEAGVPGYV